MRGLAVPAGNPDALSAAVDRYDSAERLIAAAADDLMRIVMEGEAMAVDALKERTTTAHAHLSAAQVRYAGTRTALREYTVELVGFHAEATAAIEAEHAAQITMHQATEELADAARHARSAALNPADQASLDYWSNAIYVARARGDAAEDAIATAHAKYRAAAESLEVAARRAIARIDAAFAGTDDGLFDSIGHVFSEADALLSTLSDWVTDFFEAIFTAVVEAVALFMVALSIAIAVVALIAAFVAVLVLAVVVLAVVLAVVLSALLGMMTAGTAAYRLAGEVGADDLTRIRLVIAAVGVACPILGYFVVQRITGEVSKPAPEVRPLASADLDDEVKECALASLEASVPDSLDDYLAQAQAADTVGGDSRTVVDIAKIVHEDGSVAWVVTLPSTKDWVVTGDAGATNDLDADLLLLAFPQLQSQYEKAVLEAMAQAGIGKGEPVLVTGWSLGGILAGHLAQKGAGGYDYQGVVVAGAPIDHMDIAAGIAVVQVKHTTDPVHRTDMIDTIPDTGSHLSLWDGERSQVGMDYRIGKTLGHDIGQYQDTLAEHVLADQTLNDKFTTFFVVDDPNHTGAPTIEHQQYAFSE